MYSSIGAKCHSFDPLPPLLLIRFSSKTGTTSGPSISTLVVFAGQLNDGPLVSSHASHVLLQCSVMNIWAGGGPLQYCLQLGQPVKYKNVSSFSLYVSFRYDSISSLFIACNYTVCVTKKHVDILYSIDGYDIWNERKICELMMNL